MLASVVPTGRALAQLIGHSEGEWSVRGTDPIEIYRGDRRITAYHAGFATGVPFFDPVVGPSGKSFTAPASPKPAEEVFVPTGLWFSLGNVNGYDFHPEPGGALPSARNRGRILHKGMNGVLIKNSAIVIRTKSEWMGVLEAMSGPDAPALTGAAIRKADALDVRFGSEAVSLGKRAKKTDAFPAARDLWEKRSRVNGRSG